MNPNNFSEPLVEPLVLAEVLQLNSYLILEVTGHVNHLFHSLTNASDEEK